MTPQEMINTVKHLPPVSQAALKLVALLDQPEGSNDDVVRVLKQDSVLTAKLLRACNSPAIALQEPVTSVDQAVLILGYAPILQMVTALAFGGPMAVQLPGYGIEASQLWRHSLMAASAAEVITGNGTPLDADPAKAFTIGLLHDIGKLILHHHLTRASETSIRGLVNEGLSAAEAEREVLGADHAQVGACLLRHWRLSEDMVEAVENHHQPVLEPHLRLSAVTHVADCIAHLVGAAPGWEAYALHGSAQVVEQLRIDSKKMEEMILAVCGTFERTERFMELA